MRFHLLQKANASLILPLFPFLIFRWAVCLCFFFIFLCVFCFHFEKWALCALPQLNTLINHDVTELFTSIFIETIVWRRWRKKATWNCGLLYGCGGSGFIFSARENIWHAGCSEGFFRKKNNCLFALIQRITVIALS